jgi:hypothetical protein
MTTHAPPEALRMGTRLAVNLGGRWREGTVIELRSEVVGMNVSDIFRVRYSEALPNGGWSVWHGKTRDAQPISLRVLDDGIASRALPSRKSGHAEARGSGVVLMPRAVSAEQQQGLLRDCLHTMNLQKQTGSTMAGKPPPDRVWSFGYADSDRAGIELLRPACLDCAALLLEQLGATHRHVLFEADARESNGELHLLPVLCNLTFQRVWARLYAGPSALGWHRDPDPDIHGWVCLVNLGANTTFSWRDTSGTHRVLLSSGDALLFNGHVIEHAVEEVHESTCPSFWREAMGDTPFVRVGLQMRQ